MKQKVEEANRDRDTFVDSERRLKDLVRSLETEISHVSAGLMDRDRECERLENQLKHAKAEIGRLHVDNERFMRSSTAEDNEQRLELDGLRVEIEAVNNSRVSAEAALQTLVLGRKRWALSWRDFVVNSVTSSNKVQI
ncbi:hypothetical protein BS47DRAFT_626809 [Hydnum rufescens UP504]|uniref:Uncharacterized protein n=1 Tax=Hydnum rufescens UP504 TaxID=1448309 RepID=A0A9P6DVS0_9AGAM|nr:hypothetical protein BS47DRAFT_626809 [Hydnum rufescens UP504]